MFRTLAFLVITLTVAVLPISGEENSAKIWSPGTPPTEVDAEGGLHEPWGVLSLKLNPSTSTEQTYTEQPVPTVITNKKAGPITLTETVYRAPAWPEAVNVIQAVVTNNGAEPQTATLEVVLPEKMSLGEHLGAVGSRVAVALPVDVEPIREELGWGCTGGVAKLPGWAKPSSVCDPAFKNISAGMGGVPIKYKFSVEPGANRTVVLGFCESHWAIPGKRPVVINVEGSPTKSIDPLVLWGQHVPGALTFNASDVNGDGKIDVSIEPHPQASDKNPILNVIWMFSPSTAIVVDSVIAGKLNDKAEHYVDVGGEQDQMLYKGDSLTYQLSLEPGASQSLLFLAATPAGGNVPDPVTMAWTEDSLRKAAEDVMRGYDPARWQEAKQQ